jgi:hypothetical protein
MVAPTTGSLRVVQCFAASGISRVGIISPRLNIQYRRCPAALKAGLALPEEISDLGIRNSSMAS